MSYNNRHWHDHADDVDRFRKGDELLDEEADNEDLKINFDILYQYYGDKVKVTLSSPEFDGELTFETTTGNKARSIIADLMEDDEPKQEPPKAVPPPAYRPASSGVSNSSTSQTNTQQRQPEPSQPSAKPQVVDVQEQVKSSNANPLFDIASDIAEILRLGAELKPKYDKLRKK